MGKCAYANAGAWSGVEVESSWDLKVSELEPIYTLGRCMLVTPKDK